MGAIIDALNKRKVELKSEQVNLAAIDALNKAYDVAGGEDAKSMDLVDTSKGFLSDAINSKKKAITLYKKAEKELENIKKLFKEIGVPVTDRVQKKEFAIKANMQDAEKSLASLQKASSSIVR